MVYVPRKAKVAHEKMLDITGHKRNANQTLRETPLCTMRMAVVKKQTVTSAGTGVRTGTLRIATETANGGAALETVRRFLKKSNTEFPHDPATPLQGIRPKALKAGRGQASGHSCSWLHYS